MKTYAVEFRVAVPDEATEEQVRKWVRFNVGDVCSLDPSPVSNMDLSAVSDSVVVWPR